MWPAFWTLGVDGEWPDGGEIDIMEFYRGILLANVAWGSNSRWIASWDSARHPIRTFPARDWASSYHVWRMDWDERAIDLYMDDRRMNHTNVSSLPVIREPAPIRFTLRILSLISLTIAAATVGIQLRQQFPARLDVDYVRVYQARTH